MSASLASHVIPAPDVLSQELKGETVLLDLNTEHYFGLNPVGTRVWQLLGENGDVQVAYDALLKEYRVEPQVLEQDLLALLDRLEKAGLITVQ